MRQVITRVHPLLLLALSPSLLLGCHRDPPADPSIGRRVADEFLALLRTGHTDAAWQSTTAEFKSDEGRESFARYVKDHPILREPLAFVEYQVAQLNTLTRGQCHYRPSRTSKTPSAKIRIAIAQESDVWKVEGVFVE